MKEFFDAALPWIIMGLGLALYFACCGKRDEK